MPVHMGIVHNVWSAAACPTGIFDDVCLKFKCNSMQNSNYFVKVGILFFKRKTMFSNSSVSCQNVSQIFRALNVHG